MSSVEDVLRSRNKPKEKQVRLVEAVVSKEIPAKEFIAFFESASDIDKGTCADVMKHVSAESPALLAPFIDTLVKYVNYKAPRVKWGVPEAIGNLSKNNPEQAAKAIPVLLRNTTEDPINTTVIRWCAAYALTEIAKHNITIRKKLIPIFGKTIRREKNNGVRNVYIKAINAIQKQ